MADVQRRFGLADRIKIDQAGHDAVKDQLGVGKITMAEAVGQWLLGQVGLQPIDLLLQLHSQRRCQLASHLAGILEIIHLILQCAQAPQLNFCKMELRADFSSDGNGAFDG